MPALQNRRCSSGSGQPWGARGPRDCGRHRAVTAAALPAPPAKPLCVTAASALGNAHRALPRRDTLPCHTKLPAWKQLGFARGASSSGATPQSVSSDLPAFRPLGPQPARRGLCSRARSASRAGHGAAAGSDPSPPPLTAQGRAGFRPPAPSCAPPAPGLMPELLPGAPGGAAPRAPAVCAPARRPRCPIADVCWRRRGFSMESPSSCGSIPARRGEPESCMKPRRERGVSTAPCRHSTPGPAAATELLLSLHRHGHRGWEPKSFVCGICTEPLRVTPTAAGDADVLRDSHGALPPPRHPRSILRYRHVSQKCSLSLRALPAPRALRGCGRDRDSGRSESRLVEDLPVCFPSHPNSHS